MKHQTILLFIFFLLVLYSSLPKSINAKSGCCSGHDGVNCDAGAQSNGNVICNDGWRGSSCLYSEMIMCGGSNSSTTTTHTVQYIQSTPTPLPTIVPAKKPITLPTKIHTTTPTKTPISTTTPTSSPAEAPTNTPTPEPTKSEEISPTIQPQVLGETDTKKPTEPVKTSDTIIGLSFLGLIGFGVCKIFIKIKNKTKDFLKRKKLIN